MPSTRWDICPTCLGPGDGTGGLCDDCMIAGVEEVRGDGLVFEFRAPVVLPPGGRWRTAKRKAEAFRVVSDAHAPASPLAGPVFVSLGFNLPVPYTTSPWEKAQLRKWGFCPSASLPDLDNLTKPVLDVLTQSRRWWSDDRQVASLFVWKHNTGQAPGTMVRISTLIPKEDPR